MTDLMSTAACTMPTYKRPSRLAEFDELFTTATRSVTRYGDTVSIRLSGDMRLPDRVRDLAQRESSCCSFFTFNVDGSADDLTLTISVPLEHRNILDALANRATELSA